MPGFGANLSNPPVASESRSRIRWRRPAPGAERRTVVVAGHGAGPEAEDFARALGLPLFAEPSSNARFGPNAIGPYRTLLAGHMDRIERVVLFGRPTLSRPVALLLGNPGIETALMGTGTRPVVRTGPQARTAAHRGRRAGRICGSGARRLAGGLAAPWTSKPPKPSAGWCPPTEASTARWWHVRSGPRPEATWSLVPPTSSAMRTSAASRRTGPPHGCTQTGAWPGSTARLPPPPESPRHARGAKPRCWSGT